MPNQSSMVIKMKYENEKFKLKIFLLKTEKFLNKILNVLNFLKALILVFIKKALKS